MSRLAVPFVAGAALVLSLGLPTAIHAQSRSDEIGSAAPGSTPAIQTPASELPAPLDPRPEPTAPATPAVPAEPSPTPAANAPIAPRTETPPAGAPAVPTPPAKPARPRPQFALEMAPAIAGLPRLGVTPADRSAIAAFYTDRQGEPLWVTAKGRTPAAEALLEELRRAGDYGLDASVFDLPTRQSSSGRLSPDLATEEAMISAAVLQYARAARGGRIDPPSITPFLDRKPRLYEPRSLLDQIATAAQPAAYLRELQPRHPQFERLRRAYLAARDRASAAPAFDPRADTSRRNRRGERPIASDSASWRRLLANMEQWRWMPDNLGSFYVWVNVPEYTLRVVSNGRVIHTARVVVGKIDTQTPVFSDEMEQVIFHPFWGVPESIKLNEVLPSLRGSGSVLAKHNLRIQSGGRDIDPYSVDWSRSDIRKYHVYQPPGASNVLGVVKFRFPNKHDVYMHDTPTKSLFSRPVRAESHGCMRVQDPVRLAEVILAEDKRMATDAVRSLAAPGAPENNQVNLGRRVPVHITYFTAAVADDGHVESFADIYGHEERIALALEGKAHLIKPVPQPRGPSHAEPVASLNDDGYSRRGGRSGGYGANDPYGGFGLWGGGYGAPTGPSGGYGSPPSNTRPSRSRDDWARRAFGGN